MGKRYNPPPTWPQPPAGWEPPADWQPDPTWGPAPDGWSVWADDGSESWWKRPWLIGVAAGLAGLAIGVAMAGGDGSDTVATTSEASPTVTVTVQAEPAPTVTETVTEAAPPPSPEPEAASEPPPEPLPESEPPLETAEGTLESGGWEVQSLNVGADFVDDFEADARIVNGSGSDVESAAFTITVLNGTEIIATLSGFSGAVAAGDTTTVSFLSTDSFVEGDHSYEFQVDFAF